MKEPKPYWITQADAARSCGISISAFRKWDVPPVAKIGRCAYYTAADIITNRLDHHFFTDLAKIAPGHAAYARQRFSELSARIEQLEGNANG